MNITPILFRFNNSLNTLNTNNYTDFRLIKPQYKNQLTQDTVSFTATSKVISDTVYKNYQKQYPTLQPIGEIFLDVTAAVAKALKEDGIYFVREMFENTVVKAPDSKLSKVMRKKTFDDRDAIRTTIFSKNPYDLSVLFEKIIPEYKKRGYHLAPISTSIGELMERGYIPVEEENLISKFFTIEHTKESHNKYFRELKKNGYDYDEAKKILALYLKELKENPSKEELIEVIRALKKDVPDLDIRLKLNSATKAEAPEDLQYTIGKPQKSGYEDIQLRFIREIDKDNPKPIYHELLIQFGPTYNRNAWKEHNMVYEPLRLFDELSIPLNNPVKGEVTFKEYPEKGVEKFVSDIKDMFRTKVSKVLVENGKNEDYLGNIEDNDEIFFTEFDIKKFERKFANIKGFLAEYYSQLTQKAAVSPMAQEQIEKDKLADLKIIKEIEDKLRKTIDTLNYEHGLNEGK